MKQPRINLLSVSGGKDSTALILHAIERGVPFQCVFADTGHEHPQTYAYLDYLESRLGITIQRVKPDFAARMEGKRKYIAEHWAAEGIPQERVNRAIELLKPTGIPMLDLCMWKGRFPSTKARFCTDELKVLPINLQVVGPLQAQGFKVWSWQGVRADESPRRALYRKAERLDGGIIAYRPLLRWTASDVFTIHHKHGVDPNPLYKQGMGRVGCMPCIMCRKDELSQIARRFPEVIERIAEWEQLVSYTAKRNFSTFFTTFLAPGRTNDDFEKRGIRAAVEWSMTVRGGQQFDLFKATDPIPECSSHYGLCDLPDGGLGHGFLDEVNEIENHRKDAQ